MKYKVLMDGVEHRVDFARPEDASTRIAAAIDGRQVEADGMRISPGAYSILLAGRSFDVEIAAADSHLQTRIEGREFRIQLADPRSWRRGRGGNIKLEGRQQVGAPMPGKVVRLLVQQGQQVEAGQGLLVVEAMKMQNEVRSPKSGIVERLTAKEGQTVEAGQVLAVVG